MIVYDVNEVIKAGVDWSTVNGGTTPEIMPLLGYSDSEAPFIVYSWIPSIVSNEKFFQQKMLIRYFVYDNNIDRMNAIVEEIRLLMNKADDLDSIRSLVPVGSDYRILWSVATGGLPGIPLEREGFSFSSIELEIGYVLL